MWRIFLFAFILPAWLSAVKYPVIKYHTSDGLPQNQINTLIQDQLGYIFVGTQSGIGKFDGNQFQVITSRDGLPNNYINDFAIDNEGNIWVATIEGLAKIDKSAKITSFLSTEFIRSLTYDINNSVLWVITDKAVYNLNEENLKKYTIPPFEFREKAEKFPKGLVVNNSGVKYFYWSYGILELKKDSLRTIYSENHINFLKCLNGTIVVGTEQGIYSLQKDGLESFLDLPKEYNNVSDVVLNDKGKIWVGTTTGLLFFSNPSQLSLVITNENGLTARRIKTLLIDREKNLFIGTEWGLSQISPTLFKMYDETDGLPHKFVWDFEEDNDTILISCNKGLAELEVKSGKLKPFPINQKLKDFSIRTITKVAENDFLLGTRNNGIFRWDRASRLEKINDEARVTSAVILRDLQPIIWFGTDNGLLKFDGKKFKKIKEGLRDSTIWTLDIYDRDTLYVGTGKGVQKCFKNRFIPSELEQYINSETTINDIKVVSQSEILVATELNGLYIYKNKNLTQLTTSTGLSHNDVWSVIKDDTGNIWINTSVSLDRNRNGFISHFNKKTGLFGEEGGIHGVFKSSSKKIYFSIPPGFIEIPSQESNTELDITKPILYIKKIKVKGKNISFENRQALNLDLKNSQNNIEFEYIAVSTRKENPVFYRTRLLPLDNQWSEPTRETHIKYLNLHADEYIFQVMANNGGGEESWFKAKKHVTILIREPFWLTWWFIILAIFMGVILVVLVIKIRLNSLERQKRNLEEIVHERTEKLKYLSITDPLTDLKNRRYLEEKIKEDISLIERYIYDNVKGASPNEKGASWPILGVFILDIDYFKKVNDDYGHKAGDIVIVDIAKLLIDMLRHSDTIVRWGGEEFLIITWQKEKSNSFELAERIRKKIESYEFKIDDNTTIHKTVSVGFAHFPFIPNDISKASWPHVVSLADSALYIAKNNGRNLSIGIECGARITELDKDFKDIVSNIKLGIRKQFLKVISIKKNLVISQHKT